VSNCREFKGLGYWHRGVNEWTRFKEMGYIYDMKMMIMSKAHM
jgi:hypothetical protein